MLFERAILERNIYLGLDIGFSAVSGLVAVGRVDSCIAARSEGMNVSSDHRWQAVFCVVLLGSLSLVCLNRKFQPDAGPGTKYALNTNQPKRSPLAPKNHNPGLLINFTRAAQAAAST